MKKRKVKRYQEGGETELKQRGLDLSKDERVGFLDRLKMGNIDDPRSEAYRRFGAGRAKMDIEAKTPVPEMGSDYSGKNIKSLEVEKTTEDRGDSSYAPKGRMSAADIGYGGGEAEAPAAKTFKQAFAAARRAGDKSFAFGGKKYTTELAAPKAKASLQNQSKAPLQNESSSYTGSIKRQALRASKDSYAEGGVATSKPAPKKDTMPEWAKNERANRKQDELNKREAEGAAKEVKRNMSTFGFKRGGSVSSASSRADGIAQRGKTRGKIC
jgi:hypothetical protein